MISSNGHSQRRFIVTLRVLALVAAIPIIGLREELSSDLGIVCLTTFFYLIPYVLVTIAPVQWMSQQIGLAVGYSLSMFAALVAYLVARSFGFPTTVAPVSVYKCALVLNAMLFVVGLIMWIVQRKAAHARAFLLLTVGLAYPFIVFFFILAVAARFYR
jgi:hypothetical protein